MDAKGGDLLRKYRQGVGLIKEFEGCHLKAYKCPAGVWTIGWGNTKHIDGAVVKAGDTISQAVADQLLEATLQLQVLPALAKIPHWQEMSAEQQGALISFAWNLGWRFYGADGFETITRRLKEKDWNQVPAALLLYRNPGSKFEAGLRRRREAEGNLWSSGMQPESQPAAGAAAGEEQLLFKLEALQNTWLKKEPIQASELSERKRVAVHKSRTYGVVRVTELPATAHVKVELAAGAGTWFIYAPHWSYEQRSGEALTAQVDWEDFDCLVTPNLTVGEILQWDRRRIPGPNAAARQRLIATASEFQRLRDAWGRPLGVTSFYRPEPINAEQGGVRNSRHVTGQAMDLYPIGASMESFYQWIRVRWRGGLGDGRHRGFIHLDTDGGAFVPGGGATPSRSWTY
jgi:GH24 family phage-related lysozyme (muramidase)